MLIKEKILCKLARFTRQHHAMHLDGLLRKVHNPDKRQQTWIERIIMVDHGLLFKISTASYLEWQLFFYGGYEHFIARLFEFFVQPGAVVLDIGANVGIHALRLGQLVGRTGKVYAFEPHPEIFTRLLANRALNGLTMVEPLQLAVSDHNGSCNLQGFKQTACNQGTSFLLRDGETAVVEAPLYQVTMVRLDDWVADYRLTRLDFIKVDVEGLDIEVLAGAQQLITQFKPTIIFEYDRSNVMRLRWLTTFLTGLGYQLYIIKHDYLVDYNESLLRGTSRVLAVAN